MDYTVLVCIILKLAELSFIYKPLSEFWLGIKTEFPVIPKMILNLLLLFYTTYLYEVKFLTSMIIKPKYWEMLKMLFCALQYQICIWDLILYVKWTITSISLVCKLAFVFNEW